MPINWEVTKYFDPRHLDPEYICAQVLAKEYRVKPLDLLKSGISYKFINKLPYYHEGDLENLIRAGKIKQMLLERDI